MKRVFNYGPTKRLDHLKSATYTWFRAILDRSKPLSGRHHPAVLSMQFRYNVLKIHKISITA
jgi:hypothetical protein